MSFVMLEQDEGTATLAVLHGLRQQGLRVTAMTPVVRDAHWHGGQWVSPHVERLQAAGSMAFPGSAVCPYVLDGEVGADQQLVALRRDVVVDAYRALATWADMVVVEARGAVDAQLGAGLSMQELLSHLRLPIVAVVAAGSDGAIALQAVAEQCRAHRQRLAGWVLKGDGSARWSSPPLPHAGATCLGAIPAAALQDPGLAAAHIAWPRLLRAVAQKLLASCATLKQTQRPFSA